MKISPILRIVLFSVATLILVGILLGLTTGTQVITWSQHHQDPHAGSQETNTPQQPGSTQEITPSILPTEFGPIVDQKISLDPAQIREIEIDWVAGNIRLLPDDSATEISFYETGVDSSEDRLVWELEEGCLSIEYCQDTTKFPSFGFSVEISKDLTIVLPADWVCNSLEIDAASSTVVICDLTIGELDFDGASGSCDLQNCTVTSLDLDMASGDVRFSGSLDSLDFDSASANCTLYLINCPSRIDVDGASGCLDITLPDDCGFTANMGILSGKLECEFATTNRDGCHVYGDGRCSINVNAMAGDLCIRQSGQNCTQQESHHGNGSGSYNGHHGS